jgi:ABC-type sugar transport system ATPase subunit
MLLRSELTKSFNGYRHLDNARMRTEAERVLRERPGVVLRSTDVPTDSLSGGQRQAVAIGRAVCSTDLKVIKMDEPNAALDPDATAFRRKLIDAVRDQGNGAVVISLSLDDVFPMSDHMQVKRRGRPLGW